jgi:protein-tyrosine phosphatase
MEKGMKNRMNHHNQIKVLMICHGNICRSPMAEFIFKDMVAREGLSNRFLIESAATSTEEIGNPVYPPARRELERHGLSCQGKTARQVRQRDYKTFDYLLCAEQYNIRNLRWIIPSDPEHKIHRLLDYSSRPRDISDPWYSGNFQLAYQDITEGCQAFLEYLKGRGEV